MCLAVPGRVIEWVDHDPTFAKAKIEFGGVSRICNTACVPDAVIGDYVVVHAGIAISRIDQSAVMSTLLELQNIELMQQLVNRQSHSPETDGETP